MLLKPLRLFVVTLTAATALVLPGCRDRSPLAPDGVSAARVAKGRNGQSALSHGLLPCRPLAYDSVTERIGARGGVIRVSRHVLVIPPLALSRPVDITVVAPSDTVNRLEFRPEGLIFRFPVSLTLSYANCNQSVLSKGIAYTNDSLVIVEEVPANDDPSGNKVTGSLKHFSSYAVSW